MNPVILEENKRMLENNLDSEDISIFTNKSAKQLNK